MHANNSPSMRFGFKHALVFDLDILVFVPFAIAVCSSYMDTIVVGTERHIRNSFLARIWPRMIVVCHHHICDASTCVPDKYCY